MTKLKTLKKFSKIFFSLFFLIFFLFLLFNKQSLAKEEKPAKIFVGFYPIQFHSFSIQEQTFQGDFYLWFRWKGQKNLPGFEIMNGIYEYVGDPEIDELKGGSHYLCYRIRGTFFINIDLKDYPFDKHILEIHMENQELDRSEAIYIPDQKKLTELEELKKKSTIPGWGILNLKIFERKHIYKTTFGRPGDSPTSTYSQLVYQIKISRKLFSYMIKFTVPLFVIVFMALSVFFIHPKMFSERIGIGITAILSLVALQMSQAGALPEIGYIVTADKFFFLSYFACATSLLGTLIAHRYVLLENLQSALAVNNKFRIIAPLTYVIIFATIVILNMI